MQGLLIVSNSHHDKKLYDLGPFWCWDVQSPLRVLFIQSFLGQMFLPRKVEAEDGLGELALLQQALHHRWVIPHSQTGVGHSQDPIKVWVVEGVTGFILTEAKLLVLDDNVLDLSWTERKANFSGGQNLHRFGCPGSGLWNSPGVRKLASPMWAPSWEWAWRVRV